MISMRKSVLAELYTKKTIVKVSGDCDEQLPSATTAYKVVRGDMDALPYLARDLFGRAALIGLGVLVAGAGFKEALKFGIFGATSIEVFVLGYAAYHSKGKK